MDAIRTSDNASVALKRVEKAAHPYEASIAQYLSSPDLASERNHSVPIYDVLEIPDHPDFQLLVMPLLRGFDDPPIETIGEAVSFFRQIFEVSNQYDRQMRRSTYET
jgi:hypothetical protein